MIQEIQKEIKELEKTKMKWSSTRMNKIAVSDLLSDIRMFNHTFTAKYKHAQEFYFQNSFAEIDITDGIEELKIYLRSKLKIKDNRSYYIGTEKIKDGINSIIIKLKDKQSELRK